LKVITLCLALLLGHQMAVAAESGVEQITNYRAYSPLLSSSGQPEAEQLEALRVAGFERVVFLAFSDDHGSLPNEDRLVKDLGMEFVHIPVVWKAPKVGDFDLFAGAMQKAAQKKTLVHCQVNFRASSFSFLYRVIFQGVSMGEAKQDLDSVWVPNDTWREWVFDVLDAHGFSPDCDTCLWASE
jgi:protein tyrosine phosphatase (PTP) superfamily phosphohydrolase (DUF442 family)